MTATGCSPETCGIDKTVPCIVDGCGAHLSHHGGGCLAPDDDDCLEHLDGASPAVWGAYRTWVDIRITTRRWWAEQKRAQFDEWLEQMGPQ